MNKLYLVLTPFFSAFSVVIPVRKRAFLCDVKREGTNLMSTHFKSRRSRTFKLSLAGVIIVIFIFMFSSLAQTSISFAATAGQTVMSGGTEEPYIIQQVASSSNPNLVYQITGAQIAQRLAGGMYKSYIYVFINTRKTFAANTTGEVSRVLVSGYNTNNLYWNAQIPPTSGSSSFCGTVGQDLDLGATSNMLSEWQWANMNWDCGRNKISYSGSYDGGGPTACYTYSNNQERESVYEIIVDASSMAVYQIVGAVLIQQKVNGVESSTFITLVSSSHGRLLTSGDNKDCPIVSNPSVMPSLRWYIRTPPVNGKIPGATITGNFGITGTLGEGVTKAPENGNMVFEQFVDRAFQTGYIPNHGGTTDISILLSTDPVSGATAPWPG